MSDRAKDLRAAQRAQELAALREGRKRPRGWTQQNRKAVENRTKCRGRVEA